MGDLGMHACHIPFRAGWNVHNTRAILSNIMTTRPDGKGNTVPCETWDNATLLCEASDNVDAELKWLYGNLMAFAIQYLSIGILIHKNSQRFLHEYPGNRIIALVEECGIVLSTLQKTFLKQVENTFQWGEKFPQWNVSISRDQLSSFKAKHSAGRVITAEEKKALEDLFTSLRNLAVDSVAASKSQQPKQN